MKRNITRQWLVALMMGAALTAGALVACSDDKEEDKPQAKLEALCHVLVSEDMLKVADVTVHYLDVKGQEATERMTTTEWKKRWAAASLPARLSIWVQLTPKSLKEGELKETYQLKAVATATYLFHSAQGGEWIEGWMNVPDPYAEPENVAADDVQSWCSDDPYVGCKVDAEGNAVPIAVDFGGNKEVKPVYNRFCKWFVGLWGLGPEYCE